NLSGRFAIGIEIAGNTASARIRFAETLCFMTKTIVFSPPLLYIWEPWPRCGNDLGSPPAGPGGGSKGKEGAFMAQTLPSIVSGEGGLSRYLEEIRRFPMLQPDEEYMLAKRYSEHEDTGAAHKLVTSHLRLVAKIAMGYRGYGLPIGEVISEGNVGLMQAVKKFEPERGFRLATY